MKKLFTQFAILLGLILAVSCDTKPKDEPQIAKGLIINPSTLYILADGKEAVNFTITMDGKDVTAQSKIVNYKEGGSETLTSPSFATSTVGEHIFYTIYDGAISEKIKIKAATAIPQMPVDAMPSKYDGFRERIIAMQATGLWCGWCPLVIKTIHTFIAEDSESGDVVFVAAHNGEDHLPSEQSTALLGIYNSIGEFPRMMFSLSQLDENKYESNIKVSDIRAYANKKIATAAASSISAASEIVNGKICVRADVKIAKTGQYGIGVMLLEDNIYGKQENYTGVNESYYDYHDNVIRAGVPHLRADAPQAEIYELLNGQASVNGNAKYPYYCELDISASSVADIAKARLVVYLYDIAKGECDNVISVKVGEQVSFEYR